MEIQCIALKIQMRKQTVNSNVTEQNEDVCKTFSEMEFGTS